MSQAQTYSVQFYDFIFRHGKRVTDLPESIQDLVNKFEQAKESWDKADPSTQSNLYNALVQSDVFISALVAQELEPDRNTEKVDKLKLMAFKARALQVKWKLNNPED